MEQLGKGSIEFWHMSEVGPTKKADSGAWDWSSSPSPAKGGSVEDMKEESGQSREENLARIWTCSGCRSASLQTF